MSAVGKNTEIFLYFFLLDVSTDTVYIEDKAMKFFTFFYVLWSYELM